MKTLLLKVSIFMLITLFACKSATQTVKSEVSSSEPKAITIQQGTPLSKVEKTEDQWKSELSEQEYYVLRQKGTERAFTGDLWDNKKTGTYVCAGCELPLFSSETKYRSGTGWPSFWDPIDLSYVATETDNKYGWNRTEVLCARCNGHLGHVFEDGPEPTGLRYCINSVSLDFLPETEQTEE